MQNNDRLVRWGEILEHERGRSTLLTDQSLMQLQIISLLISGSTATSKEVVDLVREAHEMGELLRVHDLQIGELRKKLES
jgi:hypothetical protein